MEYQKKYFDKTMYKFGITPKEIKRYGDYCRLEERMENARVVNANITREQTQLELEKMAIEDKI